MLGNTLLIVNPTARSNQASEVAAKAIPLIESHLRNESTSASLNIYHTLKQHDATEYTKEHAQHYQTVIALGGDGLVHETVNGLMELKPEDRPQLGLIPCGNGDDFARSLTMNRNPIEAAHQLLECDPTSIDIPCVNEIFFDETLSFGLDAAIALQTMELRAKTKQTGTSLYLRCGLDQLKNHRDIHRATISLDGKRPFEVETYMLAIQNGQYYGGGFKICPNALLNDGLLDICYAVPPLRFLQGVGLFLRAKQGKHTNDPHIHFAQARQIHIEFNKPLAVQTDGEPLTGTQFDITVHKNALKVLMPTP